MTQYRNTGAPIPREHGGPMVPTGELFEPTQRELMMWSYKLTPAPVVDRAPLMTTDAELAGVSLNDATTSWPMTLSPETYLEFCPDGEHAELARKLLGAAVPASPGGA